jgi:uncharacterized protein YgfB (UPF0149 family)
MRSTVDYDAVAQALGARSSPVHPAEAHGCLCGGLCVRPDYSRADWLEEILPDDAGTDEEDGALARLFAASAAALASPDLEFQPLLPGDAVALELRVEALAAWCQGFLYGFGAAGTAGRARQLPGDVAEVLADLARISQAGAPGSDSVGDDDEAAYTELVEFLRAAVQLAYEDLDALRASQPVSDSAH